MNKMARTAAGIGMAVAVALADAAADGAGWHAAPAGRSASDAALDIREAGLFRLADGSLVFRVRCRSTPPPQVVRLLIDLDGRKMGHAEFGADYMVEGDVLFTYPPFSRGWLWNEVRGVPSVESEYGTRSILLPPEISAPNIRWAVETLDRQWTAVGRLPASGVIESSADRIPELTPASGPPPDAAVAIAAPPALAERFAVLAAGAWADNPSSAPLAVPMPEGPPAGLAVELRPAGAGAQALEPAAVARDGERVRWTGSTAGLDWTMLAIPGEAGEQWIGLEFCGPHSAAFEIAAELRLPNAQWRAADGSRAGRPLDGAAWSGGDMASASDIGEGRLQSRWPFAVVVSDSAAATVMADPSEPRPYRFEGSASPAAVRMVVPAAVTPMTSRLPGRAYVSFLVRSARPAGDALRDAAAFWHDLAASAVPRALPAQWVETEAERTAASEWMGGPAAVEALRAGEATAVDGAWRYVRLRPWWCELSLPAGGPVDSAEALRLLRFHAAAGGPLAWYAQSAVLGACRNADDSIAVRLDGGRIRVGVAADPGFLTTPGAPWNRAMLDWAYAMHYADSPGVAAWLFDGFNGLGGLDFNRATLAAADRAPAAAAGSVTPGIPRALDAFEFLDAFRRAIAPVQPTMALVDPFDDHALFSPFADIVVMTDTIRPDPADARVERYRLLAGPRPCVRLLDADFEWLDPAALRATLADSLFRGFIPSPRRDPAGRAFWSHAAWVERDGAAVRATALLARRLAAAGWRASGWASTEADGLGVESFGSGALRSFTARNPGRAPREIDLIVDGVAAPVHIVRPLNGACETLSPQDGRVIVRARIGAGETMVADVVEDSALDAELAFLDAWTGETGEGAAAAANLRALRQETAEGVGVWVSAADPMILGARNVVAVRMVNRGDTPLVIAEARIKGAGPAVPMLSQPIILGPGETTEFEGGIDDAEQFSPWASVEWRIQRGDREWGSGRRLRVDPVPAVEISTPHKEIEAAGGVAEAAVDLRNHSKRRQALELVWEGDFPGGRIETVLVPEESRTMTLPVTGRPGRRGRIEIRVLSEGRELHRGAVRLNFADAP